MPAAAPEEFRRRAVEFARSEDKSVGQIAKDPGISEPGLRRWMSQSDAEVVNQLRALHRLARGTYGVRRVHAELVLGRRFPIGHGRVERLMRIAGLQGVHHR